MKENKKYSPGDIVLIENTRVRRIIEVTKTGVVVLVRPEQALDGETETISFKKAKLITMAEAAKRLT